MTSWLEKREVASEKSSLVVFFDKYVPLCIDIMKSKFKKIVPIPDCTHLMMLCQLLESLLTPENAPPDSPKELYEQYFVFACFWAFGSTLYHDGVNLNNAFCL